MKKIIRSILPALLFIVLANACKKGFNDQQSVPIPPDPVDLSSQMQQTVSGFITNENGQPVFHASITAGNKSTTSDEYGYFEIKNASLSKAAGFIKISSSGYFDGYHTFVGQQKQETFVRVQLVPKTSIGTINASSGGTVNTTDGATISLPANAVVTASTNTSYSGSVHVAAHLYNQDNINQWSNTRPGDNRGTDSNGHLQLLHSYGTLAVELTGDAGELLQIASGREATITTPIPSALIASAPASIPLWSFDTTNGLWKQESTTTKNGNSYTGNVQHFSFWDGATNTALVNLTVQIVNNILQPLGNVFVLVRKTDDPTIGAASYTNNQGIVSGAVPANTSLIIEVYNTCGSPVQVYSQNFVTNTSNTDLGTITANLGEQVIVTGSVVNCNNLPVTNGFVLLTSIINSASTINYRVPVTNGSFNFSTAACANMNVNYVAIDNDANQQSTPQSTTLATGPNNLGTISACGISILSVINYRIDGGAWVNLTEPLDTMMGIYSYNNGVNFGGSIITVGASQNLNPDMQFQYFGLNTLGNNHTVADIWSVSFLAPAHRCTAVIPLELTFTEFGELGGFMAGSFSGNVEDYTDHSPHTIECNFRVRRYN